CLRCLSSVASIAAAEPITSELWGKQWGKQGGLSFQLAIAGPQAGSLAPFSDASHLLLEQYTTTFDALPPASFCTRAAKSAVSSGTHSAHRLKRLVLHRRTYHANGV